MNEKKPLSNQPWVDNELKALRSEEPREEHVSRVVGAVQENHPPAVNVRPRFAWRTAGIVAAIAVIGSFVALRGPSAVAKDLDRISNALQAQKTRHTVDLRPNEKGDLILANEYWISGEKYREVFHNVDGTFSEFGYDGQQMFRYNSRDQTGTVDDVKPESMPIETIEDYMNINHAKIEKVDRGVMEQGKKVDIFTISYGNVRMSLYVDAPTGLPIRRDVFTMKDKLIEVNKYDYPAQIADGEFQLHERVKVDDYPAMRKVLAAKLDGPGETQELGGVKITLKAVLLANRHLVAIWSGGAKTDYLGEGHVHITGLPQGIAAGMPTGSVWPDNNPDTPPIFAKGKQLIVDGIWYDDPIMVRSPFTLEVPVWTEDKTRPLISQEGIHLPGYHSKLLGKLKFKVTDPIFVADPQRLIWPPDGKVREAKAMSG
jgi:hypothetical protein